jgi:hypothetical protein
LVCMSVHNILADCSISVQTTFPTEPSVRRKMHLGLISLAFSSGISLEVLCLPRKI